MLNSKMLKSTGSSEEDATVSNTDATLMALVLII
jgi:hypothetical protein